MVFAYIHTGQHKDFVPWGILVLNLNTKFDNGVNDVLSWFSHPSKLQFSRYFIQNMFCIVAKISHPADLQTDYFDLQLAIYWAILYIALWALTLTRPWVKKVESLVIGHINSWYIPHFQCQNEGWFGLIAILATNCWPLLHCPCIAFKLRRWVCLLSRATQECTYQKNLTAKIMFYVKPSKNHH